MRQIWFGIPTKHMQWCPAPLAGAQASNVNHVEGIVFENGGADVSRSKQYRKEYSFNFSGPSKDLDGVGIYNKFASGFYGDKNGMDLSHTKRGYVMKKASEKSNDWT